MTNETKINIKQRLSILWILVLFNMLFADVFSIMVELVNKNTLQIPGDVMMVMAVAALITNIPIFMIFLSRVLAQKLNRICNIIAALLTIVYVIGGGDSAPHYLIVAAIEIALLISILVIAWKWKY